MWGGGGEEHVRPPMCESDFMFFQVKFFPLLICFSIGVGGGGEQHVQPPMCESDFVVF